MRTGLLLSYQMADPSETFTGLKCFNGSHPVLIKENKKYKLQVTLLNQNRK